MFASGIGAGKNLESVSPERALFRALASRLDKSFRNEKDEIVVTSSSLAHANSASKESKAKRLLAELRQMTLTSQQEDGLLNHAQAALVLDVSTRRISELVQLGKLKRHNFLGRTYVSVKDVLARRSADVKAGRPARSIGKRLTIAARVVANYDAVNAAVDAITPEPKKKKAK